MKKDSVKVETKDWEEISIGNGFRKKEVARFFRSERIFQSYKPVRNSAGDLSYAPNGTHKNYWIKGFVIQENADSNLDDILERLDHPSMPAELITVIKDYVEQTKAYFERKERIEKINERRVEKGKTEIPFPEKPYEYFEFEITEEGYLKK